MKKSESGWTQLPAEPAMLLRGARWSGDGARLACTCGLVLPHDAPLNIAVGGRLYGQLHLGPNGYCQKLLVLAAPRSAATGRECDVRLVTNDYVIPREPPP